MTKAEKLDRLRVLTGETDNNLLLTYLDIAGERVCRKAYPFSQQTEVPDKYALAQVEIAVYLLNKRGAEGETYHSENGINRTYEAASVPDSMLACIIPAVGVI